MFDLRMIISLMPGMVYWKDRRGVYRGSNYNAAKLAGFSNPDHLVGKTIFDFAELKYAESVTQLDERIMSADKPLVIEEEGFNLDRQPAIYLTQKIPLHNKENKVNGLLGISIDITAQKLLEQELTDAKFKAEASNIAKTEFLKNMRHDIRTPFSGILGLSEYLAIKEDNVEKKEDLTNIAQSAKKLLDFLNDVMETIEHEPPENTIINEAFDIYYLASQLNGLFKATIADKNITFNIIITDQVPKKIIGNRHYLYRVLLNLIGNAIKFTEKGGVYLTISVAKAGIHSIILAIEVKDTGIGIAEADKERIFEKFTRLTPAYSGKYPGTGLGLFMVSEYIKAMNGTIQVSSKLGMGTIFRCDIPFTLFTEE